MLLIHVTISHYFTLNPNPPCFRVSVFPISCVAEPLAMLVLEVDDAAANMAFEVTRLMDTNQIKRMRVSTMDWTPEAVVSRARRHYIVGDRDEMLELGRYLAKVRSAALG